MSEFAADYAYVVVPTAELEARTRDGWELVKTTESLQRHLIRRVRDEATAEHKLGARVAELQDEIGALERTIFDLREARRSDAESTAAVRDALDQMTSENAVLNGRCDDLRDRVESMAEDIGKVRREIGDARWREIVGDES